MRTLAAQFLILILLIPPAWSSQYRDPRVRAEWMKTHPCPSNGKTRGACPGWEADHVRSLCSGGSDTLDNLMWLEVDQHRLKTLMDVKECAIIRAQKKGEK